MHKEKVWKHKFFNSAKQGQGQYIPQESIITKFTKKAIWDFAAQDKLFLIKNNKKWCCRE